MVDFKYADLFLQDSNNKQLNIAFDSGTITNTELHSENFELTESLCSEEQLRFGTCEAGSIKFKISNIVTPLKDKWLTVTETLGGNSDVPFSYGKYKVSSDKPTADRRYRDIIAYDAMYDIIHAEVAEWYNTILPEPDSTVTLKVFRNSFLAHFGIEQEEVDLVNDSMTVEKTIEPSSLSGKVVITAICEINGCFGHMGRDGRFHYIFLQEMGEGLYPSDTLYPRDDLYPVDPRNAKLVSRSHYISAKYEDFTTAKINKLQIRQEEDDIGCIHGTGDNCYVVQDNFLIYGKSAEELEAIAANLYSVICNVWYRPASVEAKGNPCIEVGDGIRLGTKYEAVFTYVLQRTLKGIQALRDTYDAEGEQYQREDVNSVRESIIQLKGKTNRLTRTVEETRMEIADIEKGLSSRITQNAESITAEVERAKGEEGKLGSLISQTAEQVKMEVSRTYSTKTDSEIKYDELSGKISVNADNITAEVKRAQAQEVELAAAVSINAENITLRVSKGNVSSEISQESGKISIKSNRFSLESTNCTITEDGTISAKNVDLTGKITADSGKIGGFMIGSSSIFSGSRTSFSSSSSGIYIGTDGVSIGASSNQQFKVTAEGEVSILGASGNITLGSTSTGRMILDKDGISFGTSALTTVITKDKVKVYDNYIDSNGLHCGGSSSLYTDISGAEVNVYYDYNSFIKIGYKDITLGSGDTHKIIHGTSDLMSLMGNAVMLYPTYTYVAGTSGYLGFFGASTSSPSSKKQTVLTIGSTSGATTVTNAEKINELINALKAYNLIG